MIRHALACLILAALVAGARAGETPPPLPEQVALPELLRMIAQRSPRLAAERAAIDAAEADRIAAAAYPNPTVSVGRYKPAGGARTVFDASSQSQATLDLPVLLGGQRRARMDAAEQALEAARAHVGAVGHETAAKAAESFVGLLAAQEKVRVLDAAVADVQRLARVVAERMANGMASRYEATRAEIELAALRTRRDDARMEEAARAGELAMLVGVPGWKPVARGNLSNREATRDRAALTSAIKSKNALLLAARREEEAALAALRRAERERVPVPVVSVGRTWTGDPFGAANFVGLSAEIPILDRRLGPVARAEAELRAVRLRREAIEAELDTELARTLDALAARRATLAQFDQNVGARLEALRQMAEDYYQLGRGSLLELIDSARSRLESTLAGLEVQAQVALDETHLLALSGELPEQAAAP